ncbi:MAG: translation elongation factor 4 [Candidatus Kaiserbacteria bacterium]|nr:translation elongation factor 4 [Candidatus Kaiserbacteria bacterium]
MENIRNFSIIAHVDHGKSTLADRLLEHTGTIEKRKMQEQVLDRMDIERERGITIKMQPVSLAYQQDGVSYMLNIIDTPGHIDFSYEVSRSLRAVEGVLLLVDATQGVQAQTLSVLEMAQELNLVIIPVLTKIDMGHARTDEVSLEVADLLDCNPDEVLLVSGKTGEGIEELLRVIIKKFPAPQQDTATDARALVFDFSYTNHTGVNAFARVFGGSFKKGERLVLREINTAFSLKDVGVFKPDMVSAESIEKGMIGYFTTGIKEPGIAVVGDTITRAQAKTEPFPGYQEAVPVIWVSLYPQDANDYNTLHHTLQEMRLVDAAFTYEEERSTALGKGFRCGFLGMLHFEIITERVRRQAGIELVVTAPSTDFIITKKGGETMVIATPAKFPDKHEIESVTEPWVAVDIIAPAEQVPALSQLIGEYEGFVLQVNDFKNNRCIVQGEMPLREMMRQFFDKLKSISSGYASLSYKRIGSREADVTRLDILLAEEEFPAFASIVSRVRGEREARELVSTLHETIPRALFVIKIQAKMDGRIVASKTLPALRKDVTAKLYGGDITRKMKLREKQKKGKQKMGAAGRVTVSHDTFLKVVQRR